MSGSSKSRPDEYDPITDYHYLKFENRCLRASGDDFQNLFEAIMVRARPGEFERVRPYGKYGDRKCDGLIESEGIIFQVYSPDELKQAEVQKKIDEDLEGAVQHWSDILKKWVFVYNAKRGITADIKLTLRQKRQQYPDIEIDSWSNDYLWEITRNLSIEQRNEILGLPPSPNVERKSTYKSFTEHHWQETCRSMLPLELDANPLISGDGVTLGIEDIVPLDLVERKERPKPTRDPSPENFHQAPEDQEIPLPYNRFFEQVLTSCKSRNEQGKGIAIIGDPGAGKTTLLCAIAAWITQRNELPIFVSLQDLEIELETYLLETWLSNAISKRKAPEQLQDDLVNQCNAGRVWLLLDGVDEMAEPNRSLSTLAKKFKGWVGNTRIVLTCRVNVWEANRNELRSRFEVYRSRGFRDEEQCLFIQNFFAKATQVETGIKLVEELEQAPPRLKDLIRNPLWLTLLCRTWKRQQGKLPATKAELYEGFIRTFYDWKDKPSIPEEKRPSLERALGELAKNAIDRKDFRFRLRETFIRQELDKFDPAFFSIACELGWINKLGSAVENPDEPVYAFLHPTFQEYFTALAIDDWDYFLPFENTGQSSEDLVEENKCYRIFEPQWTEAILLWIGRPNLSKNVKQSFVDNLVSFEDMCVGCYDDRAFLLAASLIAEFDKCDLADEIADQLIAYAFGDYENSEWVKAPDFIVDTAKSFIPKVSQKCLFSTIEKNYKLKPDTVQFEIAELLIDSCKNNRLSIEILENLAVHSRDAHISLRASTKLLNISIDNEIAIKALEILTISCGDDSIQVEAATELLSNDPQNQNALRVLIEAASEKHDILAIEGLSYSHGNVKAIEVLRQIIEELKTIVKDAYDKDEDEDKDKDEEPECSSVYWAADDSLYRISPQPETSSQGLNTRDLSFFIPDDDYINDRILEDLEELERYISEILWTNEKRIEDEKLFEELLEVYLENYANDKDEILTEKTQTEIQISEVTQVILHNIEELLGGKDSIIAKVLDLICSTEDDEVFYDTLSKLEEISDNDVSALNGVINLAVRGTRSHRLNMVIHAIANIGGTSNLIATNFLLSVIVTP
jgi:energy-coupling factor transporter ATP-binding protein EcfA2